MAKKLRRAFTIVELVIVIAVIAILAAVLIPTFTTLIDRANLSADQQAVQQMNTILTAEGVENKPQNVEEAKKILQNAGYNVDSYVPMSADKIFYYDLSENKVLIYDQKEQQVIYPQELVDKYTEYTDGRLSLDWYMLNDKTYQQVTIEDLNATTISEAVAATNAYQTIVLNTDMTLTAEDLTSEGTFPVNSADTASIDLNGNTLKIDINRIDIDLGTRTTVRLKNGTIDAGQSGFVVGSASYLQLENIKYTGEIPNESEDVGAFMFLGGDASEVLIKGCDIVVSGKAYGITTNASGTASWDVIARIEDSTVVNTSDFCVLVNVPGTYSFKNSTLQGNGGGVLIRGGKATFENCLILENGDNSWAVNSLGSEFSLGNYGPYVNGVWANGNMVQFGALIVGDWNPGYSYDASCSLINTEVRMEDAADLPAVYLSQDAGYTTTFTYDSNCSFTQHTDSVLENTVTVNRATGNATVQRGTVIVNGETYVW